MWKFIHKLFSKQQEIQKENHRVKYIIQPNEVTDLLLDYLNLPAQADIKATYSMSNKSGLSLIVEHIIVPDIIDIGYGYQGRKLCDGRYVLEQTDSHSKQAVDLVHGQFSWPPSSAYYGDCIANNAQDLIKRAKRALSEKGI